MSHSQLHRVEACAYTCMALRQAYDYWQDQPDFQSACPRARPRARFPLGFCPYAAWPKELAQKARAGLVAAAAAC